MRFFTKKKTINKIFLVLALVITLNFVTPNLQVQAAGIGDVAGMLLSPVRTLTMWMANGLYSIMQFLVLGNDTNTNVAERIS